MLTYLRMIVDLFSVRSGVVSRQRGATMIEYALIAALIAIAAVVVIGTVGDDITSAFTKVANELPDAP